MRKPYQARTEAGTMLFKKAVPVLFQIPVMPRSTKRREGNAAMLQVERNEESLAGGVKMQAVKMNSACPKPHCSLKPDLVALEGPAISNRQAEVSCPQIKPWETAEETKASGLVV